MKLKKNIKGVLAGKLEAEELKQLYKTYDIVGDIAIIRVPEHLEHLSKEVAKAVMSIQKEVKSVWMQSSSVSGDYRLRELEHVLGKNTTETVYREYGCVYKTDLRQAYFSPRLSFERMRIAKLVQKKETVLNMFAGVGCYSIAIAKHAEPLKVISVDLNPVAFKYLEENIRLNRVEKTVFGFQGDAKTVTETKFQHVSDRILMPLPEKAYEYLDCAVLALKPEGGWIHYYDFVYAQNGEDPTDKIETKVSEKLSKICSSFQMSFGRVMRSIGPRWYQVVLDVQIQN
jgi:tRNA (guanine37-N1)-methyltransferase